MPSEKSKSVGPKPTRRPARAEKSPAMPAGRSTFTRRRRRSAANVAAPAVTPPESDEKRSRRDASEPPRERPEDERRHQPRHVAPEPVNLLHEAAREVRELFLRREEDRLDLGVEAAVHQRHLELVLEVGDDTEPADDDVGVLRSQEV